MFLERIQDLGLLNQHSTLKNYIYISCVQQLLQWQQSTIITTCTTIQQLLQHVQP